MNNGNLKDNVRFKDRQGGESTFLMILKYNNQKYPLPTKLEMHLIR